MNDKADDPATRRLKWVKKKPDINKPVTPVKPGTQTVAPGTGTVAQPVQEEEDEDIPVVKQVVLKDSDIEKECNEISNQRGHLKSKPEDVVARISLLLSQTKSTHLKIKLLNLYILICFDTSSGHFSALSLKMWQSIHDSIITLMENYKEFKNDESEAKSETVVRILITLSKILLIFFKVVWFQFWKN